MKNDLMSGECQCVDCKYTRKQEQQKFKCVSLTFREFDKIMRDNQ
jgi:hypothetical protein